MTKELPITQKVDDVMGYMNFKFHDYELHKPVHLFSSETYKDYLSTLWHGFKRWGRFEIHARPL